ncbi:zinc finger protein 707-like [Bradysia coprophila]|uniref:zinc finger protein 707-like n=1 Tax=Bradysia coprophila TaxID=38358 RepID=UPI00187DAE40|nr:zinc finger protein 707-like [Bradysia coprophila]
MGNPSTLLHSPTIGVRTSAIDGIGAEILNFDNFRENLTRKVSLKNWFLLTSHQHVHIFNVDKKTNGNLSVRNTISIDTELMANVYDVNDDTLSSLKLCSWSQFYTLIEQFSDVNQGGDVFVVTVIEEDRLSENSREVEKDYEIDQLSAAATFEFCATNSEVEGNDLQRPFVESIVKVEPTDDTLDWEDTLVHVKNETEEQNELAVEQGHLVLVREKYPAFAADQRGGVTPKGRKDASQVTRKCTICDKDFSTKKKFRNHMYLHDRSKFKECHICHATCFNIRRHIESVHKNVRKDVCHICGAAYKQLSTLKAHMDSKHNEFGEYFCDICNNGKNYRTKMRLKCHITNVHVKGIEPGKQAHPKKQLSSKAALKSHMDSKHSDDRESKAQFQCETCDKVFKRKQALTSHVILHSGKKFDCTECGQSFSHPDYLSKHRRHHKEVKCKE